jgi:hypothetical protein
VPAPVFVLDPLLDDAGADDMVRLAECFDGYGLYVVETSETEFAPELSQRVDAARNFVRSGGRFGRDESAATLALRTNYLRETYAYGEEIRAPGIEAFRTHAGLYDAARQLFGRPVIEPAIVYANFLLPGQELAVHTDVPEFRGANRKVLPQWLLVVMHHSGLFEPWRMPIATGIAYFAPEGAMAEGGELAYYPDGADGPPTTFPTRHNTAVLLDTDSVFHGVDRVGPPGVEPFPVAPGNVLRHDGGDRWSLRPDASSAEHLADFAWADLRFSISWKAYCFADEDERDAWRHHADDLTVDRILATLRDDLAQKGELGADTDLPDRDLALLLIDTYERYPAPAARAVRR